jgi:carboxymethylenebutenolidase
VALDQYIAEEIALDCQDGLLTRREAVRRLGLLGFTATAASALLAACSGDDEAASPSTTTTPAGAATTQAGGPSTTAGGKPVGQDVTFDGKRGRLQGSYAAGTGRRGAVLVIHENRGLTQHIKTIPPRIAAAGYSALAIDLLSEEGGTATIGDEGKVTAALAAAPQPRLLEDIRSGLDELATLAPGQKLAITGFCFGGGQVWQLLNAGEPRLAAAIPFYGPAPATPDFSRSKAAVLGIYAEKDTRVNGTRDAAKAALEKANLVHEIRTFPGVDHAFFNDTGARYDQPAATQAFDAMVAWLQKHLA